MLGTYLLENAAGIFYGFTYLALFAIPLFGAHRLSVTPPLWLRAASACGFAVTLLYSVLSVFPIIDAKVSGAVMAFAASTLLYTATALVVGIGTPDAALLVLASWIACATSAVGVYSTVRFARASGA